MARYCKRRCMVLFPEGQDGASTSKHASETRASKERFLAQPNPHKASFTTKMLPEETVDPMVVVWKTIRMQSYNRILGKWGHCTCLDMQLRREKDLKTLQKQNILGFQSGEGNHWPWLQVVYKVRV